MVILPSTVKVIFAWTQKKEDNMRLVLFSLGTNNPRECSAKRCIKSYVAGDYGQNCPPVKELK